MASITFDEEVFCNHLSKFYESWKAVSLLARPHINRHCSQCTSCQLPVNFMHRLTRSSWGVLVYCFGLLCCFVS